MRDGEMQSDGDREVLIEGERGEKRAFNERSGNL